MACGARRASAAQMAQAWNIATHGQDPMVPDDFNPYAEGGSAIVIDDTNAHLMEEAFAE